MRGNRKAVRFYAVPRFETQDFMDDFLRQETHRSIARIIQAGSLCYIVFLSAPIFSADEDEVPGSKPDVNLHYPEYQIGRMVSAPPEFLANRALGSHR
jgi:hypothetical protein